MLGPLTVKDKDGVPISNYQISADEGAWNQWDRKLLLFSTNGLFSLVRLLIGAMCWLLDWGLSFGLADTVLGPARTVSQIYQDHVIAPLGLAGFLLTMAAFWCGLVILRGRTSRGAAELGISVLISAVAATVLANPADLLLGKDGLLGTTRNTAMAMASIVGTGGASDSQDPGQVARPITDTLVATFVVKPNEMLNFGVVLDDPQRPSKCLAAYKKIVKAGAWQGDVPTNPGPLTQPQQPAAGSGTAPAAGMVVQTANRPEAAMIQAGCKDLAAYNHDPTWDRLLGALLLLFAALLVTVLVVLMVSVLLVATVGLAFYAIAGHAVAVIAVLPGGARAFLWRWLGGVAKIIFVIFAAVIVIPLLALFIAALMTSAADQSLIARFFLIDIVTAAALVYHRKLIGFGARAGYRIARRLEWSRYGGSRGSGGMGGWGGSPYGYGYGGMGLGWLGAGDPHGISPVSLTGIYRGVQAEIGRVARPIAAAKHTWVGDRAANAKAVRRLGADAGSLKKKMYATRGGRTLWRTGAAATIAGRTGLAYTVGLPVSAPRAGLRARNIAVQRSQQMKTRLAAAKHNAQRYGATWSRNTGLHAWNETWIQAVDAAANSTFAQAAARAANKTIVAAETARLIHAGGARAARDRSHDIQGLRPPTSITHVVSDPAGGAAAEEFRRRLETQRADRARHRRGGTGHP